MPEPYYKQHWIDIDPDRHTAYDQILAYRPALEPILRLLELRAGLRVLDVGSGPGYTTLELARRVAPSGKVTGVDINAEFVARASARAREQKSQAEFVHSAFPPLPFPDGSFDRVFCKNVLEYVDSAPATVAEMARVAAAGGVVFATDSDWDMLALDLGAGGEVRDLTDRVLAAAKSIAVKEPRAGRRLYGIFRAAGLANVKVESMAGADTAGRSVTMLTTSQARYARDSGRVSAAEVERWVGEVKAAIAQERYLFVLPQFVVWGNKS
ncbi:MAG TPA: methyltransferase domain-containing protein [Candidatus Binataceae bacterium]|nr:methyltransferase domain-containing protein [Candidatus Binataceae bacterium]